MTSNKIAHRHEERNFRPEIVPNPFGGGNPYLWGNEAYVVGIAPSRRLSILSPKRPDVQRILRLSGVV
jgi:hypothetical protein